MNTLFLAMILGLLFGFVLVYIGAANYKEILKMLQFRDLRLMKTILFGIGLAGVLLNLGLMFNLVPESHLSVKSMNLGVIFGAIIFGVGFGYGGTCPGTCVAGSSNLYALLAVLGGLVGAILFSYMYPFFASLNLFENVLGGKITLFPLADKYASLLPINGGIVISALMMVGSKFIPQTIQSK